MSRIKILDKLSKKWGSRVSSTIKTFEDFCMECSHDAVLRLVYEAMAEYGKEWYKLGRENINLEFTTWVQDNYSTNTKQGGVIPLPKGMWRKDFTDDHYSIKDIYTTYNEELQARETRKWGDLLDFGKGELDGSTD